MKVPHQGNRLLMVLAVALIAGGFLIQRNNEFFPKQTADPAETNALADGAWEVARIIDGDSVELRTPDFSRTLEVRLHGVDAPEYNQTYGDMAELRLRDKLKGQMVTLEALETDQYGRTIGIITLVPPDDAGAAPARDSVNKWLLKEGLAWHYKRHDDRADWARAETAAREAERGLWSLPDPEPPWSYRDRHRQ